MTSHHRHLDRFMEILQVMVVQPLRMLHIHLVTDILNHSDSHKVKVWMDLDQMLPSRKWIHQKHLDQHWIFRHQRNGFYFFFLDFVLGGWKYIIFGIGTSNQMTDIFHLLTWNIFDQVMKLIKAKKCKRFGRWFTSIAKYCCNGWFGLRKTWFEKNCNACKKCRIQSKAICRGYYEN